MSIIEVTELSKRYRRVLAVDRATFRVERGQVFGFLGPNGSGKTTTIGMLLNVIHPTSGKVRLFDKYEGSDLHRARKRIGATLETPNFYPYLSGFDNLRVVARIKGVGREEIDRVLDQVGLASRGNDLFRGYSLGMKQRLSIAAALLGNPELILLDEPLNGLDPEGMREIRDLLIRLREEGRTLFISSHLLFEVERTCTHAAILRKGEIVRNGAISELVSTRTTAFARSDHLEGLVAAAREYPGADGARIEGEGVTIELNAPDTAELNRYLAERGIYLSHLSHRRQSLEELFFEVTSELSPGAKPNRPEEAA